ncbi:MAG: methyltransferase domain-containing protein [Sedimentisphaerales bacterium]
MAILTCESPNRSKMTKVLSKLVSFNIRLSEIVNRKIFSYSKKESYKGQLSSFINEVINKCKPRAVLEVGGIDKPLLQRSKEIRYDGLNIVYKEQYERFYDNFIVQSIEDPIRNKYDLIISKAVLEHIQDNDASIKQMYQALRTGGYTIHYLPSKYHPYSLVLRLLGPKWQRRLIKIIRPWARNKTGYPAFFNKCSPKEMRKLFKSEGFDYVKIIPFFRANYYFNFFLPFYIAVTFWENICAKLKWEQFCSGFIIIARR